jgi:tetratricopeptide (TPR) repeat protein
VERDFFKKAQSLFGAAAPCKIIYRGWAIKSIENAFNTDAADGNSEIKEKLKKGLQMLGADEASTLPYLLELFSVKDSGIPKIAMSAEEKKHRITEAIKGITIRGSEIRPLIIAIEDLHWIDKSSEDYLKDLLDSISGSRIFLIFTFRPEFVQTWGGKSYHSQVNLNRLSNRESLMMVAHILGSEEIDGDLEQLILEKAEGFPFFIEEFVKSLIDIKIIEWKDNKFYSAKDISNLTVPSTIQDVIMARIDSLPENAKEVLQTGSAIDREFAYDLIKQVTKLPEQELLSNLSVLKDSELLVERGIYPNSRYIFRHALTREVLYDSVITQRKKKIHEEIGNAIEILYKDNINEHYGILAEHYNKGANYERGIQYSTLAVEGTEKTGSINEAIAYAWKIVESLERLPQTHEVNKKLIKARTALGLYLLRMLYYSEAKKVIDPIIDLAMNSGHKEPLPGILTIIGSHEFFVEENVSKAFKNLEKAYKIAEELKDNVSIAFTSLRFGVALGLNCEFEKATYYFKKALSVNMATNTLWAVSITNSYLSYFSYFRLGNINMANQASAEAIRLAQKGGDIYSKAFAYTARGISYWGKGSLENAKKHLLKGFDYCDKINFLLWKALASRHLGEVYYEIGEYKKSKDYYAQAAFLIEKTGSFSSFLALMKTCVEMAKVKNNENDLDFGSLYAYSRRTKIKIYEALNSIYMGEILFNIGNEHLAESESWFNKAIEMHKRYGMMWYLARDYVFFTALIKRKGNEPKARETLANAIEIFKKCGADGWAAKYEKEMAEL